MTLNAGIVGCGDISDAYLSAGDRFDEYRVTACSSRTRTRAEEKAAEYGIRALDVDELLSESEVDLVVNLTPPSAHAEVSLRALEAGNHVYTEKPIAATVADSERILAAASERGLLVGSAPDTILGAALQTCRAVVDEGWIGTPIGATVHWTSSGHESWHPNPELFYREGGGPLFDVGPYYLTALVSLLGPVARVAGAVGRGSDRRTITSDPREGETVDVTVPTHEAGVVTFDCGATANVLASFDVVGGSTAPDPLFELYGTDGTLRIPDPNYFDGPVRVRDRGGAEFEEVDSTHGYTDGRGVGIVDLVRAVETDWDHRTSGALAAHVLEVMEGVRTSSDRDEYVHVESDCERPAPLPAEFP